MSSKAQRAKRKTRALSPVLTFEASVAIESAGEDKPPRFSVNAYNGGKLSVNAYPLPVVVELGGMETAASVTANLDHDQKQRVGHVTETVNDGRSLVLNGEVSAASDAAAEVIASASRGYPWQASIEAQPTKPVEELKAGKSADVNGQTITGPAYIVRASKLHGFAFLSRGADETTTVAIAAERKETRTMKDDLRAYIEAAGLDPDELEDATVKFFEAQMAGVDKPKPKPKPAQLDDVIAQQKAEQERQQAIARIAGDAITSNPDNLDAIEAKARLAIEAKQDTKDFELELFRSNMPGGGFSRRSSSKRVSNEMLEAAICLGAGMESPENSFKEETLEAADKAYPNGIGLQEFFHLGAKQRGYRGQSSKFNRQILEAAFSGAPVEAAGWSYADIGGILSNVANKFLTNGFSSVERAYPMVSTRRPTNDFKSMTSYALTGSQTYEKVGDGGDLPHGTLGELPYGNRVETYGKTLTITRQTIVNDDLNALGQVPFRLGRGAALSLNRVFWTEYMDNAAFWTEGNGTRLTGAGSVLDEAGLNAAETAFDALKDPDGEFVGSMAEILLVPPTLYNQALRLMNSSLVVGDTDRPDSNVFQGRYSVVKSRYLEDAGITGNSATAWYLLASPSDMSAIEIAYLNGRDTPTVESADADFSTLGVQMRGFHDFGVAKQEYRSGIANDGA